MANPWDRRKGEPALWYDRFLKYFLPLGPERNVNIAYREFKSVATKRYTSVQAPGSWNNNANKWDWRKRAEAWDTKNQSRRIKAEEDAIEEMLQRHLRAAQVWLGASIKRLQELGKKDADIKDMSLELALRAFKVAIEAERQARGLPTHLLEIMNLTDEELLDRYRDFITRIGSPGSGDQPPGPEPAKA